MNVWVLAISFLVGGAVGTFGQSSVLTGSSLSLQPTEPAQAVSLAVRTALTTFPVPAFRPETANTPVALDVMPNGAPAEFGNNGYAWADICDADIQVGTAPVTCARIGARSDRIEIGARSFDGGTPKMVALSQGGTGYLIVQPSGQIQLVGLQTFADNAAATAGGIPVNGLYRTAAGAVMVRF